MGWVDVNFAWIVDSEEINQTKIDLLVCGIDLNTMEFNIVILCSVS